ncbi:SagB family peptide dehydrogenase [Pseudonocardia sp. T1-2H]|uniref:SagB family peptide dehydrogenase n=1 Tax=Pseudonocardia sp. T1-2H TaxID=3128899 RepID=UPI0031015B33
MSRIPAPRTTAPPSDDVAWEIFHENSKTSRHRGVPPDQVVVDQMQRLHESLSYRGHPLFELPRRTGLRTVDLQTALDRRATGRKLTSCAIPLGDLSTVLHYAYGVREQQPDGPFPRAFRSVPSGGALYPLEMYVHAAAVVGLPAGLFHYEPVRHVLRLLREEPAPAFESALVQPGIARAAAATIFITAIFYRSTFKYGDRGYRFVLLEAGHVGQNIDLIAAALGFAAVNVGGYFDRDVDAYLDLDGLNHSTVYLTALGGDPDR